MSSILSTKTIAMPSLAAHVKSIEKERLTAATNAPKVEKETRQMRRARERQQAKTSARRHKW